MERRNFLKGLFGIIGAAAAPAVGKTIIKPSELEPTKKMRIQVCSIETPSKFNVIEWCGKTWKLPEDNGRSYVIDTVDILDTSVKNKFYDVVSFQLTVEPGYKRYRGTNIERVEVLPIITPIDTGDGINMEMPPDVDSSDIINSALDYNNGIRYFWWYEN